MAGGIVGNRLEGWLFLLAFAAGLVVQGVFRLWLDWPAVWATVVLCALMIAYAVVLNRARRSPEGAVDGAGDALYFIGFLFTAVSLAVALLKVNREGDAYIYTNVLPDLGIGIATTILGLAMRTWFSLTRPPEGIDETERRIAGSIAEKAERLDKELNVALNVTETMRIKTRQVLEATTRSLDAFAEAHAAGLSRFQQAYDDHLNALAGHAEKAAAAVGGLRERIDAVEVPRDLIVRPLQDAFRALDSAVGGFSEKVAGIDLPPDLVAGPVGAGLRPLLQAVSKLSIEMEKVENSVESMNSLNLDGFNRVGRTLSDLSGRLEEVHRSLEKVSRGGDFDQIVEGSVRQAGAALRAAFEDVAQEIREIKVPGEHAAEQVRKVVDDNLDSAAIKAAGEGVVTELAALRASVASVNGSLDQVAARMGEMAAMIPDRPPARRRFWNKWFGKEA